MNRSRLISTIILLNVIVFLGWAGSSQEESGFMARNFLVSWTALREGRIWTLLTSVFSHAAFFHIFLNMFVLSSFGPLMEQVLGTKRFLRFYLVAGVISSLSHSLVSAFVLHAPGLSALGASGAISGVVMLFALLFPKERIYFFALIPVPALAGAVLFVGMDLWGLIQQTHGAGFPIGYGAHLGGALTGFLYYRFFLRSSA